MVVISKNNGYNGILQRFECKKSFLSTIYNIAPPKKKKKKNA